MKKLVLSSFFAFALLFTAEAQNDKPSPAAEAKGTIKGAKITINYSQPGVKGRTVWGDLVPYDAVWRTGANEATWIETSKDITIQGETLPAGKYGVFTIPGQDEWTVIFNETWNQWGAYEYDASKDVLRVSAKPNMVSDSMERMTFAVAKNDITLGWDKLRLALSVK